MENGKEAEQNQQRRSTAEHPASRVIFRFQHASIRLAWGSRAGFIRVLEPKAVIAFISSEFDSEALMPLASTSHASPLLREAKS